MTTSTTAVQPAAPVSPVTNLDPKSQAIPIVKGPFSAALLTIAGVLMLIIDIPRQALRKSNGEAGNYLIASTGGFAVPEGGLLLNGKPVKINLNVMVAPGANDEAPIDDSTGEGDFTFNVTGGQTSLVIRKDRVTLALPTIEPRLSSSKKSQLITGSNRFDATFGGKPVRVNINASIPA